MPGQRSREAAGWVAEQVKPASFRHARRQPRRCAHRLAPVDGGGTLTIITLGYAVIGTFTSLSAVVESQRWGTGCAGGDRVDLGLWWMYFTVPA
jgi:hypothetical protein